MPTSTTPDTVIRQIVDAMRTLAGPRPGFRPVHAKGVVCSGTFRASAEPSASLGRPFRRSIGLDHHRFANANGSPDVHDGVPNVRSMAVKFQLSDGKNADILANSVEGFVVRTPEELLDFLRAQLQTHTGRPTPMQFALSRRSSAGRAFVERLMKKPIPASYAQVIYHAEHAFRFTAADGTSRFGRYRFIPLAARRFSTLTLPASDTRTSSATSWKDGCGSGRWRSACSCNWRKRATRRTTSRSLAEVASRGDGATRDHRLSSTSAADERA